jgi:hypothetical protein
MLLNLYISSLFILLQANFTHLALYNVANEESLNIHLAMYELANLHHHQNLIIEVYQIKIFLYFIFIICLSQALISVCACIEQGQRYERF